MSKIDDLAAKYLKSHHCKEVYSSSDGYLFTRKQDAISHAKTLKDKNIKTHRNGKVEDIEVNDPEPATKTGEAATQKKNEPEKKQGQKVEK